MPQSSQINHPCLLSFGATCQNTPVDGESSPLFSNVVVIPFSRVCSFFTNRVKSSATPRLLGPWPGCFALGTPRPLLRGAGGILKKDRVAGTATGFRKNPRSGNFDRPPHRNCLSRAGELTELGLGALMAPRSKIEFSTNSSRRVVFIASGTGHATCWLTRKKSLLE